MSKVNSSEWLETSIKSKNIKYFDYKEFTEHKIIGKGGFGVVESAEWNKHGIKVALKSLKDENVIKEFVKEVCKLLLIFYNI